MFVRSQLRLRGIGWLVLIVLHVSAASVRVSGAELKRGTIDAFNHYVRVRETRITGEVANPTTFLWSDPQFASGDPSFLMNLRQGHIFIERLQTRDNGRPIPIPDGLIHHWIGLIFVPGVTLREALALAQDYDHHQDVYKPDVQRSKLLNANGSDFRAFFRFYRKTIVTVSYNAQVEVRYYPVDATREYSRSYATRIAEVDDPGKATEHERPVGDDHGYLWRLNTYTRYAEKDGGVYIQVEFIALSRSIPFFLAWVANSYLQSVPRDYLTRILESTRETLLKRKEAASISGGANSRRTEFQ